jgi:hypothetical protein
MNWALPGPRGMVGTLPAGDALVFRPVFFSYAVVCGMAWRTTEPTAWGIAAHPCDVSVLVALEALRNCTFAGVWLAFVYLVVPDQAVS